MTPPARKLPSTDAIEFQQVEDVIKFHPEQLQMLVTHAAMGLAFTDTQGRFLYANPVYCKMLGYSVGELCQTDLLQITHVDDRLESERILQKLATEHISSLVTQRRYLQKDGHEIWMRNSISVIKAENGAVLHYSICAEDATDRWKKEEERFRLAAIVDSSDDAIISKTLSSIITSWNHAAEKMFGYTAAEAIGRPITMIIPPELQYEEVEIISKLRRNIAIDHFETVRVRKDGSKIDVSLSISPVRDDEGRVIGAAKIARDISERKAFEQRKDEFISMASHELKTPITSLKGFTQILQRRLRQTKNEDALNLLARMDAQINKITKLIGELLDVSKMQAGPLEYHKELFNLNTLVQEMVENVQGTSRTHSLGLTHLSQIEIVGDRDRIGQVVMNLLTNAIKYSPDASRVDIRVDTDPERHNAIVSVQDYGLGIAKDHQQHIFERFYRVRGQGQTFPGLGIGLSICNEIVTRHGGQIIVESEEGKGSTFSVLLPYEQEY